MEASVKAFQPAGRASDMSAALCLTHLQVQDRKTVGYMAGGSPDVAPLYNVYLLMTPLEICGYPLKHHRALELDLFSSRLIYHSEEAPPILSHPGDPRSVFPQVLTSHSAGQPLLWDGRKKLSGNIIRACMMIYYTYFKHFVALELMLGLPHRC